MKATAPYCLRCRRTLEYDHSRTSEHRDTCTGRRATGELAHDQCGGPVVHSTRMAPKQP